MTKQQMHRNWDLEGKAIHRPLRRLEIGDKRAWDTMVAEEDYPARQVLKDLEHIMHAYNAFVGTIENTGTARLLRPALEHLGEILRETAELRNLVKYHVEIYASFPGEEDELNEVPF